MFGKKIGKTGIVETKKLDEKETIEIIHKVATKLVDAYPSSNLSYLDIYKSLIDTPMYYAKIPTGISKVNYYYKNSTIYFKEGIDLSIIDEYVLHEFIHKLQEKKDKHGNIIRIGICEFNFIKIKGAGLNEGAVEYVISNVLNKNEKKVNIYGIDMLSKSEYYPILTNLISQLAYLLGENELVDSTIHGNEEFKFKIIDNIGFNEYNKIEKNMNLLLQSITKEKNDTIIRNLYFNTQEIIYKSYFNNILDRVENETDIEEVKDKFNGYENIIGKALEYNSFNEYKKEFTTKIQEKIIEIQNKKSLMVIRYNTFFNILRKIKRLFTSSTNES